MKNYWRYTLVMLLLFVFFYIGAGTSFILAIVGKVAGAW